MCKRLVLLLGLIGLLSISLLCSQEKKSEEKPVSKEQIAKETKISPELQAKIEVLIKQLGDEDWRTRESAEESLRKIGEPAKIFLKEAIQSKDPEVKMRATQLLRYLDPEPEEENKDHASLKAYPNAVIKAVDDKTGKIVKVKKDGRTVICRTKDGKLCWETEIDTGNTVIRDIRIAEKEDGKSVITLVFGKHSFGQIDLETGQYSYSGSD